MILCIGTTPTMQRTMTFERLRLDEVNRAVVVDEHASGKSVNVARVASQLGADVVAMGFAGGDRGRALLAGLDADGIPHDFVRVAPATRLCTTVIDRRGGTVTELVEESSPVTADDWLRLRRRVFSQLRTTKVCVLSGSLPPAGDEDFYRDVAIKARSLRVPTVIDTRGRPLLRAIGTDGLVVKLNREELGMTIGQPVRGQAALRKAMKEICPADGQVIVTMGGDGAMAWDGKDFHRIQPKKIKAVNPIGSGDAFAAGLAVGILRKLPPKKLYALASFAGASNALHPRAGYLKKLPK